MHFSIFKGKDYVGSFFGDATGAAEHAAKTYGANTRVEQHFAKDSLSADLDIGDAVTLNLTVSGLRPGSNVVELSLPDGQHLLALDGKFVSK